MGILPLAVAGRPRATALRRAPTVDLTMIDDSSSRSSDLRHDVEYRSDLENDRRETDELTAPTFFAIADIDNPDALNDDRTHIVMQPGETKDISQQLTGRNTALRRADSRSGWMVGGITVDQFRLIPKLL